MPAVLLEHPVIAPAKCANCGNPGSATDGRRFLDLNIQVDRYGRIYICTLCLDEWARLCGYIPATDMNAYRMDLDTQGIIIAEMERENAELRRTIASFGVLGIVPGSENKVQEGIERLEQSLGKLAELSKNRERFTAKDIIDGVTAAIADSQRRITQSSSGESGSAK